MLGMRTAAAFFIGLATTAIAGACHFDTGGADGDGGGMADAAVGLPDAVAPIDAFVPVADTMQSPDARVCPAGYVDLEVTGTAYRFVPGTIAWLAAEQACEAEGTHLIAIDDVTEQLQMVQLVGASPEGEVDQVWIGINDRKTEGGFRFVTGAAVSDEQLFWNDNEPLGAADCVAFYRTNTLILERAGRYNDENCGTTQVIAGYICECDGMDADPASY